MAKRKCLWVTADGTQATLSTRVRSTHRTWDAAMRAAEKARCDGHGREVVHAQVMAGMQAGLSYTEAVQAVAGLPVEAVIVEVQPPASECRGHETTSGPIGSTIYCDGSCRQYDRRHAG